LTLTFDLPKRGGYKCGEHNAAQFLWMIRTFSLLIEFRALSEEVYNR
jgi:hypothetical protein